MPKQSKTVAERHDATRTLGQLIREKRLERGVTVLEFARRSGMARSYLYRVEEGSFDDIRMDKFCRIVATLQISADQLLQEAGYLPPKPATALPEPDDYLRQRYKLSPEGIDQAVDFLEWLARRERRLTRSSQ